MVKHLLTLCAVGAACGLLLTTTRSLTAQRIEDNRESRARALIETLLGRPLPADFSPNQAIAGDCTQALVQRVETNGYAGAIAFVALWSAADDGASLRVTRHQETPGIGDFIDHEKSSWISQYDRSRESRFTAMDNVAGATITTAAVRRAAQQVFANQRQHCD